MNSRFSAITNILPSLELELFAELYFWSRNQTENMSQPYLLHFLLPASSYIFVHLSLSLSKRQDKTMGQRFLFSAISYSSKIHYIAKSLLLSDQFNAQKILSEVRYTHFREDDHGAEPRGEFPHEPGVLREPHDLPLVPAVQEDGAQAIGTHPVLRVDEVPLLERRKIIGEAEVVETLLEVPGLILVFWLLSFLLMFCCQLGFIGA